MLRDVASEAKIDGHPFCQLLSEVSTDDVVIVPRLDHWLA